MLRARSLAVGVLLVTSIVPLALPIQGSAVDPQWESVLRLAASKLLADPLLYVAASEGLTLPQVSLSTTTDIFSAIKDSLDLRGVELSRAMNAQIRGQLQILSSELKTRVAVLLSAINSLERNLDKAWADVTEEERAWLLAQPEDSDDAQKLAILGKVDRALVIGSTVAFLNILEIQSRDIQSQRALIPNEDEIVLMSHCPSPDVVVPPTPVEGMHVLQVGFGGCTSYNSPPTILSIDLGGDDEYGNNPGTAVGGTVPVSISVDVAGNDAYGSAQATGDGMAVGVLFDLAGDDTYSAPDRQGTGWNTGIGYVMDASGTDTYQCASSCQGSASALGIGILWDAAGDDDYIATGPWVQGYARSSGVGILLDQDGADYYIAPGVAQGFSSSGGTAALVDRTGGDTYNISASNVGRATHNPANLGNSIFLDMDGDDNYQPRADGGTPPDSRDATAGKFEWGPGSTGAFYIKGMDCEGGAANCVPATGVAPVDDLNDDLGTVECIATSLPNEAACPVK